MERTVETHIDAAQLTMFMWEYHVLVKHWLTDFSYTFPEAFQAALWGVQLPEQCWAECAGQVLTVIAAGHMTPLVTQRLFRVR